MPNTPPAKRPAPKVKPVHGPLPLGDQGPRANVLDQEALCAMTPGLDPALPPNCDNPSAGDDQADPDARGI